MELIDTHAHIYYDKFINDIEEVIERAMAVNVSKIICVAVDLDTAEKSLKISEKYKNVYLSAGIHPHEAKNISKDFEKELEPFYAHPKTVAVGEIGLDYHYNISSPKEQKFIYIAQLELAKSLGLPVIVHCRNAEQDVLKGILNTKSNNGVIHCFSGNLDFATKILKTGFKISFTGLITFTGDKYKNVIESVDLSNIMVETDSPYLTPIPNRGKRNEPAYVRIVAEKIAEWKNISIDTVSKETTKTAYNVFTKLNN